MKSFVKQNLHFLIVCLIAVCFTVLSAFSLGNLTSPSTYYQTGELEGVPNYNSICVKVDMDEGDDLDSVWINLGSIDYVKEQTSTVSVYTSYARGDNLSFYTTNVGTKVIFNDNYDSAKIGSWRIACVNNGTSFKNADNFYFLFSTANTVKINEVAFVGKTEDGKKVLLKAEPVGAGALENYTGEKSKLIANGFPMSESAKKLAYKIIDEQNKFDLTKINGETYQGGSGLTAGECAVIESVRNLTSGRSFYIDAYANPFGYSIIALGTSVFGYTSFGVRIMPFLFTLASIFVVYCIGNLLTGKKLFGVVFSFLFAFCGYSLFFATVGKVDAILLFFILSAFYCAVKFVKRGVSTVKPVKGYMNILLGGAAFTVALAVKTTALFYALPILGIFVFGIIKQYLYAKGKGVNKTSAYKRKATITVSMGVIGYVFLPIILLISLYLIFYSAYSGLYGSSGVLSYGSKAFFAIFGEKANSLNGTNSAIGYIVNYTAHKESATKFAFGNMATVALGFFSALYCLFTLCARFFDKKENPFLSEDGSLRIYFSLMITAIFGWLLTLTLKCTTAEFYIPSVFGCGLIALALFETVNTVKTDVVNNGKNAKQLLAVNITAAVLAVTVAVFFALAVPAFIGLNADTLLFSWQVLKGIAV